MNSKLNIQELSEQIAKELDMSVEDVSTFLDAMFLLVYDTLLSGEEVRIKGIGVFKLALVDKRESVDVNTGGRIEIPQHYKVAFTPDNQLKEAVNKPFSIFDTIDLSERVEDVVLETHEIELLDRVEAGISGGLLDEEKSNKPENKHSFESIQSAVKEQELLGDDLLIAKDGAKREESVSETDFTPSELMVAQLEKVEHKEESTNLDSFDGEGVLDKKESGVSSEEIGIDEENEMPRLIQDAILAAKAEWSKDQLADKELLPSDIVRPIEGTDHVCNYPRSGSFSISLLILLAGFAMGGMCVYCYFLGKNIEDKVLSMNTINHSLPQVSGPILDSISNEGVRSLNDTVADVKNDTIHIASVSSLQNEVLNAKSTDKASNDNKDLSIQIKLKNGMRLALLAEQYYGNKVFWVYIYEANKEVIKNPNILPVGVMINIPAKSIYSINAKDSTSLEKAKKLQSQLLAKFE